MNNNKRINELQEKFRLKKIKGVKVAKSMDRMKMTGRAERMSQCGSWLKFLECSEDHFNKLVDANFCRDRFCPMCSWRRSRLLSGQILDILHVVQDRTCLRYMFLTLSVENVMSEGLSGAVGELMNSFNDLFLYKEVDGVVAGWIRTLEITYNDKDGTYHPHFHVLIGVKPGYFKDSKKYISQARWTSLWQRAARLNYKPIVDVRAVRPKKEGQTVEAAVYETVKYSVKDSDYIRDKPEEMDKIFEPLLYALKGRRLVGFGKQFRKVRAELKQANLDSKSADLVGTADRSDCNCPICNSTLKEMLYKWDFGVQQYVNI